MNKIKLLAGLGLGLLGTLIGSFLFITLFTSFDYFSGIQIMKSQGSLGKLITLGSIPDLLIFAALLKYNKEIMARGVILAVLLLTILTIFI
jgi:hypothetical protein